MNSKKDTKEIRFRHVPVDKDLNAQVRLDPLFPFILSRDDLAEYRKGFVNWHKQSALEISVVIKGAVNVRVLEQENTVTAGEAFLVFPGNLHTVTPHPEYTDAQYYTLIFEPELLVGSKGCFFDTIYYSPVIERGYTLLKFSRRELWAGKTFELLDRISRTYPYDTWEEKLQLQRIVQDIWITFQNTLFARQKSSQKHTHTAKILKLINYIHEHYHEKFSLTHMAESVHISRGECCRYFKQMMHTTVSDYLLEYRLSKAMTLLDTTTLTITEIADAAGFGNTS